MKNDHPYFLYLVYVEMMTFCMYLARIYIITIDLTCSFLLFKCGYWNVPYVSRVVFLLGGILLDSSCWKWDYQRITQI